MKIYEFKYCPCIHESGYITISTHRTESGADKAMKKHKNKKRREFINLYKDDIELKVLMKFGENEDWCVRETELLD